MALLAMKIGEAARQVGISVDAIRYYERRSLLPHPRRTAARYRVFTSADLAQLRFVRRAQQLGFSLREIAQLTQAQQPGSLDCRAVSALVRSKLEQLRNQRRQLAQFEHDLRAILVKCSHQPQQSPCRSLEVSRHG